MEREFNDIKDVFKVLQTTQEEKEYMIVIGKHLATTEKFPIPERRINRDTNSKGRKRKYNNRAKSNKR